MSGLISGSSLAGSPRAHAGAVRSLLAQALNLFLVAAVVCAACLAGANTITVTYAGGVL